MSTLPIVPTFIIQNEGLFREGLRLMLSKTHFRPQACGSELEDLTTIPSDGPTLFIVGIEKKDDSICKRVRTEYPHSFIVAVGDETNRETVRGALDHGANAALLSSVSLDALINALQSVVEGRLTVVDNRLWSSKIPSQTDDRLVAPIQIASPRNVPSINNVPLTATENDPPLAEPLSAREIAVLERIVRGDSNKHVARFFNIAEATVKAHVKTIFRKIGASNRTQAAIWALNHRLFEISINGSDELSSRLQHIG